MDRVPVRRAHLLPGEPDPGDILEGLFIPDLRNKFVVQQVVRMVGCIIMPHHLFLHSALVQSRKVERGQDQQAIVFFTVVSSFALFTTLLINLPAVVVIAKGFYGTADADQLGLVNAWDYLGDKFGAALKIV